MSYSSEKRRTNWIIGRSAVQITAVALSAISMFCLLPPVSARIDLPSAAADLVLKYGWTKYGWTALLSAVFTAVILTLPYRRKRVSSRFSTYSDGERWLRDAFEDAFVGLNITDDRGRIRSVNKGFGNIVGYSPEELTGTTIGALLAEDQESAVVNDLTALANGTVPYYRVERRFKRRDGQTVWVRSSVTRLKWIGEHSIVAICEDITEQKLIRERLNYQATHDLLTGLPNRCHFEENLEAAISQANLAGDQLALLFVDLDRFKQVNDRLGHPAADRLLKEAAARLRARLDPSDFLARVGGDEFTIVMTGADCDDTIREKTENLLRCFDSPFQIDEHEITIGASIGISLYPVDGQNSSGLMSNADAAMYEAKRSGTNQYRFMTARMKTSTAERLQMELCLRKALAENEISLHFQPQFRLENNSLVRFEALCRWTSAELGNVAPDRFIPVAEETGLIVPIGLYVLREACRHAMSWQIGDVPVQIAVNVSAIQFARGDFVGNVTGILREAGLNPGLLELELTESSLVRDLDESVRKMRLLRELGVRISIDDFGTGYSSLSYLQSMPIDALKVDRSFTAKIDSSPTAASMVGAVIAMTRALALRVVVEGVETLDQLSILRRLGCDEVQGYFCGRPEPSAAALERVRRGSVYGLAPSDPSASDLSSLEAALTCAPGSTSVV
jgi:diguanylate cyclase (GGDEF)-like protein/PAS domain S-box-containing protein